VKGTLKRTQWSMANYPMNWTGLVANTMTRRMTTCVTMRIGSDIRRSAIHRPRADSFRSII
jgi:hypothetical protein